MQDTFEIELTDHNRDVILEAAQRLYRSHRTRLRQHFQIYETNEQALENKPDEVSEEDWVYLVNYFSTPKFKVCWDCTFYKYRYISYKK